MSSIVLRLFFVLALVISGFESQGLTAAESKTEKKAFSPSAKTLGQRLFAVHATQYLPVDNAIQARLAGMELVQPEFDFRCTVHFALGELVRPVEGVMSWEEFPFAVVTPLVELLPQLINLNCYDSFILADYRIGSAATFVLPIGYTENIPTACSLYYYDPLHCSLRQAVDEVIAAKGGWAVRMSEEDREDELREAWHNGVNINTPEFFAPLLKNRPYLSIGCRFDPLDGEAYRFGQLENFFYEEGLPCFSSKWTRVDFDPLKVCRKIILGDLSLSDSTAAAQP